MWIFATAPQEEHGTPFSLCGAQAVGERWGLGVFKWLSDRKRGRGIKSLAPLQHRFGLNPSITEAYLSGEITPEDWMAEAKKATEAFNRLTEQLVAYGVPQQSVRDYYNGDISPDQFKAITVGLLRTELGRVSGALKGEK